MFLSVSVYIEACALIRGSSTDNSENRVDNGWRAHGQAERPPLELLLLQQRLSAAVDCAGRGHRRVECNLH